MPWYDNGTLEQWAGGDKLQEWMQVRSVLLDDLVGLVHLHAHGVIHGDVKPANILVDARERGLLADFDISINTARRRGRCSGCGRYRLPGAGTGCCLGWRLDRTITQRHPVGRGCHAASLLHHLGSDMPAGFKSVLHLLLLGRLGCWCRMLRGSLSL